MSKSREYEQLDFMFRVSKECLFIDNIIKARLAFDLHECIDHIYFWNNVRPLDRFQLKFIQVVVDEIQTELDRKLELRRLEQMKKDLATRRREKRKELSEQMKELGLDPGVAFEAMEQMFVDDEKAVEDTKQPVVLVWEKHFVANKKDSKKSA